MTSTSGGSGYKPFYQFAKNKNAANSSNSAPPKSTQDWSYIPLNGEQKGLFFI